MLPATIRRQLSPLLEKKAVAFWIDVLNIPVDPEYSNLRSSAIARMAPTYLEAAQVLVLDGKLSQVCKDDTPDRDIFAKLVTSAWDGRCWTLQEACLARNLYIQLADGVINDADRHFGRELSIFAYTDEQNLYKELFEFVRPWSVHRVQEYNQKKSSFTTIQDRQLVDVWNALLGRSTTKEEDVTCILANLLGFSVLNIMCLPPNKQMKAMFCAQERIPLNLVCSPSARVQSMDGLDCWVPQYPGGEYIDRAVPSMGFAEPVISQGLVIDPKFANVVFWIQPGVRCPVRFVLEDNVTGARWWICVHHDKSLEISTHPKHLICLVMNSYEMFVDNRIPEMSNGYRGLGALLTHACVENPTTVRGTFKSSLSFGVWSPASSDSSFWMAPTVAGEQLKGEHRIIINTGRFIPQNKTDL